MAEDITEPGLGAPASPSEVRELRELAVTDQVQVALLDREYAPFPSFAKWAADLVIDHDGWAAKYAEFSERRDRSSRESVEQAVQVALRAAAVDTGAIEGLYQLEAGFTISVATQQAGWEQKVEAMGSTFQALFQYQLRAYELAADLAKTPTGVTEAWIRELHAEICRSQRTYRVITAVGPQEQGLPLGEYKHHPNHVKRSDGSFHAYAPKDATPGEMQRLIAEFRTQAFLESHPVLQAAYAHFGLVAIHPFADGNGRVARALASTFLYRVVGVPLVVFVDQGTVYLASLEASDRGLFQHFVDFVFLRCVDSLDFVSDRLGASAQAQSDRISAILRGKGLLTPAEIDEVTDLLYTLLHAELNRQQLALTLPTGVNAGIGQAYTIGLTTLAGDQFRFPAHGKANEDILNLYSATPNVSLSIRIHALSSKSNEGPFISAVRNAASGRQLNVRLDEVSPQVTASFRLRLSSWVERTFAEALADFGSQLEGAISASE